MTKQKIALELEVRYDKLLKAIRARHAAEIAHIEHERQRMRWRGAAAKTQARIAAWHEERAGNLADLEARELKNIHSNSPLESIA